jgi:FKBP-type peptidyl-prolyl cis-trans isomerase
MLLLALVEHNLGEANMRIRKLGVLLLGASLVATLGCEKKADLSTDKGKYSYAIGHQIAKNMKTQQVDLDPISFSAAVKDVLGDKEVQMTDDEMRQAIRKISEARRQSMQQEADGNKKKGEDFLANNKKKDGVQVTDSGLQYRVIKAGDGPKPASDDTVEVHYRGKLIDGSEFDSSYSRNEPSKFPVRAVIKGWTEALQLMNVGSTWELTIPSDLAYGPQGNPNIPPNSVLIFEVELLGIDK